MISLPDSEQMLYTKDRYDEKEKKKEMPLSKCFYEEINSLVNKIFDKEEVNEMKKHDKNNP